MDLQFPQFDSFSSVNLSRTYFVTGFLCIMCAVFTHVHFCKRVCLQGFSNMYSVSAFKFSFNCWDWCKTANIIYLIYFSDFGILYCEFFFAVGRITQWFRRVVFCTCLNLFTSALSFSWMAGDAQLHCTIRNNIYTLLSFLKDCCSIFGQISEIWGLIFTVALSLAYELVHS